MGGDGKKRKCVLQSCHPIRATCLIKRLRDRSMPGTKSIGFILGLTFAINAETLPVPIECSRPPG